MTDEDLIPITRQWTSALVAMSVAWPGAALAYGGFRLADDWWGDVTDVMLLYGRGAALAVLPYVACSIWMERTRFCCAPLVAYLLYDLVYLWPRLFVTGEFGPAHVAIVGSSNASLAFACLLLLKCVVVAVRSRRGGRGASS
jgi:hypothetical protein